MLFRLASYVIAVLLVPLVPLHAASNLDINTRFVQGSFDVLLPDGWVAALDGSGTLLLAEGPDFKLAFLSVGWEDNAELYAFHDVRLSEINAAARYTVSMVEESANGPEESRSSILELSFVQNRSFKASKNDDDPIYHVQISRPGTPGHKGVFGSIAFIGKIEKAAFWADHLVSILDSLKVLDPQVVEPPSYRMARSTDESAWLKAGGIAGDWKGEAVLGDILLEDEEISIRTLWSAAPNLQLLRNGRYSSSWFHTDFDFMAGDVAIEIKHEETGRWRLEKDQLHLTPSSYEGSVEVLGEAPEVYDEKVKVTRRYDVTLHEDALILRGRCAEYQMLPDCLDPYTGEPRILGFVLKPAD